MAGYNDYGKKRAIARMNANKKKKSNTKVKGKVKSAKRPPVDYDFMLDAGMPAHKIDWDDYFTDSISEDLKRHLKGSHKASIFEMPAGHGKTAIIVSCLGKVQEERGEKLDFIVSVTPQGLKDKNWQKTINSWNEAHPDNRLEPFLITSTDMLKKALEFDETFEEIKKGIGDEGFVVIDEVHKFKNPTGRRAKSLKKLKNNQILGLSATTETNNVVSDIISYLIMAGYYPSMNKAIKELGLEKYVDRFFKISPYDKKGHIRKDWEEKELFFDMWNLVKFKPKNISGIDKLLPNVHTNLIQLDYDEDLLADIRSLAHAYKNRMFESFGSYYIELIHRIYADPKRIDTLIDIITGDSVTQPLVFYWHVEVRDALIARLEELGLSYKILDGEHKLSDKDKEDLETIFLIQYMSGSEQTEFVLSNTSVFYENQRSYVLYEQSKARNVRRNMEHDVSHYYLVSDISFDRELYKFMQDKANRNKELGFETIENIIKNM